MGVQEERSRVSSPVPSPWSPKDPIDRMLQRAFALITTWRRRVHSTRVYLLLSNWKAPAFAFLGSQSPMAFLRNRAPLRPTT